MSDVPSDGAAAQHAAAIAVNTDHGLAVREFLAVWLTLPPLVRASVGANVAHTAGGMVRHVEGDLAREGLRMPRRARVSAQFCDGYTAFVDLAIALANAADDEAVARGIDADIEPAPKPPEAP